jgi:hypothetical protein
VLLDLIKAKQIKRRKFEGQYLYLSSDKARSTKQLEQRDQLSIQARRVPVFISSALAKRGLPIAEKDVMSVFDHYDIEKKTADSHYFDT